MNFGFLRPEFLLLAAPVLIGLIYAYLKFGKARRQVVASTIILKQLRKRSSSNKRPRVPWRMLFELLILSLLIAVLAGLHLGQAPKQVLVLVDNSLSLSAKQNSQAKQNFLENNFKTLVSRLGATEKVKVCVTSPRLNCLSQNYIEWNSSTFKSVQVKSAEDNLDLAIKTLLKREQADIFYVLSDHYANFSSANIQLINSRRGELDNLAIRSLKVVDDKVKVLVKSYSKETIDTELKLNEATQTFSLQANTSKELSFPLPKAESLTAEILHEDALIADNRAILEIANTGKDPLVVSEGATGLEGAKINYQRVTPDEYSRLESPDDYPSIIFNGYRPQTLPKTNSLIISAGEIVEDSPQIIHWQKNHPILRYLNPEHLDLQKAWFRPLADYYQSIASSNQAGLIAVGEESGARRISLAFPLFPFQGEANKPLSILTLNILNWLESERQGQANFFSETESNLNFQKELSITDALQQAKLAEAQATPWQLLITAALCMLLLGYLIYLRRDPKSLLIFALRSLAILSLLAALYDFSLEQRSNTSNIMLAMDSSKSMTNDLQKSLQTKAEELGLSNLKKVTFAKDAKQTNFEELLSKHAGDLVLLSDGNETQGNVLEKLKALQTTQKIYPIIPDDHTWIPEIVKLENLQSKMSGKSGSKETLRIAVRNLRSKPLKTNLEIVQNNQTLKSFLIDLSANTSSVISFESTPLIGGTNHFSLQLKETKVAVDIYITAKKRPKVLLLSSNLLEEQTIRKFFEDLDFELVAKNQNLKEKHQLNNYRAVIVNNVALKDLPGNFAKDLDRYIKNGGSFLMTGGNKSFGLGGYKDTLFEEFLPVKLLKPQKIKKRANVAVSLVLDKSGSMKQSSKIDFTKLAARSVLDALKNDDYFGVIGFDSQPFIALEMQQMNSAGRAKAMKRINLLFPNGSTYLLPAMDEARVQLERARAGRKHMIILTDGRLPDANVMGDSYLQLAAHLKGSGITVSTFLIGPDDSKLLEQIAARGGGTFHRTMDASTLPRLFLQDVRINTGEKTQKEANTYQVGKNPLKKSITKISFFPNLLGYVATKEKEKATTELLVRENKLTEAEPLFAYWNYGKGRSAAFTSDVSGRWSRPWLAWPEFYQFWTDAFKYLLEDNQTFIDYKLEHHFEKNRLQVNLNVYQKDVSANDFKAKIKWANQETESLFFNPIKPGYFQATLASKAVGLAELEITSADERKEVFKISVPDFKQIEQPEGINKAFLHQLASLTGGQINPRYNTLKDNFQETINKKSLVIWFVLAGLCMILLEIVIRERWSSVGT